MLNIHDLSSKAVAAKNCFRIITKLYVLSLMGLILLAVISIDDSWTIPIDLLISFYAGISGRLFSQI